MAETIHRPDESSCQLQSRKQEFREEVRIVVISSLTKKILEKWRPRIYNLL